MKRSLDADIKTRANWRTFENTWCSTRNNFDWLTLWIPSIESYARSVLFRFLLLVKFSTDNLSGIYKTDQNTCRVIRLIIHYWHRVCMFFSRTVAQNVIILLAANWINVRVFCDNATWLLCCYCCCDKF